MGLQYSTQPWKIDREELIEKLCWIWNKQIILKFKLFNCQDILHGKIAEKSREP